MFVAYKSKNGNNVTISPRIGSAHEEPKYTQEVQVKLLDGTSVDNNTYNINAQCTKCRSWPLSFNRQAEIDAKSTAQPMIYAVGDDSFFQSDSQEASIKEHMVYGMFAMNLEAATGEPGVPKNTASEVGVTHSGDSGSGHVGTVLHALIMGACFVILFPIGSLLIQLPLRLAFWFHLIWQGFTVLGVLIGFALGVSVSIKNQKHPQLNSVHQGLGMAVVLLVLIQPTLGFLHHRSYKQSASPTLFGKIHRAYLGPAVILLGIINGAVGLDFASNKEKLPAYFGFVIFIAIITALAQWVARRRKMRSNAVNSVAASNFREGRVYGDVPLQSYGRTNGNNMNPSQQSFAQAGVAPPQYVNVMPKNQDQRMF